MKDVKIGQVWKDRDKRMAGRQVVIHALDEKYAYCHDNLKQNVNTRLRIDRLQRQQGFYLYLDSD